MASVDLVAREEEFKKLNKQLEKKTESLMKEIEHVMQKPDFFSDFSQSLTLSKPHHAKAKNPHCCTPQSASGQSTPTKKNTSKKTAARSIHTNINQEHLNGTKGQEVVERVVQSCSDCAKRVVCDCCSNDRRRERIGEDLEFLYAFVTVSVQEKVLPPSFIKDQVTVESVCKFLASKAKLMQEQINRLQATIDKKAKQCEAHLGKQAELETERLTLVNKMSRLQSATATAGAKHKALTEKLEEKERLYKEQRSENDKMSSEAKQLRSRNTSLEARCASLEDSVDGLKQQLDAAKKAQKDLLDSSRSLAASHTAAISKLEGRIKALVSRAQKQDSLIKNLREQRAILTADGAINVLEKQFQEYLLKDF